MLTNLSPDITLRYVFQDEGQDFVSIDLKAGEVVGCMLPNIEPMYKGWLSYDFYADKVLRVGGQIRISESPEHTILKLKWPIAEIQQLNDSGQPCCTLVRGKWKALPTSVVTEQHRTVLDAIMYQYDLLPSEKLLLPQMQAMGLIDKAGALTVLGRREQYTNLGSKS